MSKAQLISCRTYGGLLAVGAVGFAIGGFLLLYWSATGFPPQVLREMEVTTMDPQLLLGFKVIGWTCLALSALNMVFSAFAFRGSLWPLIANTVGWTLCLAPTLAHPTVASIVLLGALLGLTAIAVAGRYSEA